jgi:hypothetical protein
MQLETISKTTQNELELQTSNANTLGDKIASKEQELDQLQTEIQK